MALRPETIAALRESLVPLETNSQSDKIMEAITPVLERAAEELKDNMADGLVKVMMVTLDEMINARRSTARAYGIPPRVVEIEVAAWDMVRQILIQHQREHDDKPPEPKGSARGQWQQHGG